MLPCPLFLTKPSSVEKSILANIQYLPTKAAIVAPGKGVGVENQGEVLLFACQDWLQGRPQSAAHESGCWGPNCDLSPLTYQVEGRKNGVESVEGAQASEFSRQTSLGWPCHREEISNHIP